MTNYFIGYKQGNGEYIYVSSINDYSIGMTVNPSNAIDFISKDITKNICTYLNLRDLEQVYLPLIVKTDITEMEVVDNDIITGE